jgi:hypothetical protein
MAFRIRLTLRMLAASGCLALSGLVGGCGNAESETLPFEGVFVYSEGTVQATCLGVRATQEITDLEVKITRAEGGLDYVAGPRCKIWLEVNGDIATIRGNAECDLAVSQTQASGVFTQFSLRASDGVLHHAGSGSAEIIVPDSGGLACEAFAIAGILVRKASDAP